MLTVLMPCFGVAILITSIVLYATANDLNIGTCAKWRGWLLFFVGEGGSIWLEDFDHKSGRSLQDCRNGVAKTHAPWLTHLMKTQQLVSLAIGLQACWCS